MRANTLLMLPIEPRGGVASKDWAKVEVLVGGVFGAVTLERGDMVAKDSWQPDGGEWALTRWITPPLSTWLAHLNPALHLEAQLAIFSAVVEYLDDAQARAR